MATKFKWWAPGMLVTTNHLKDQTTIRLTETNIKYNQLNDEWTPVLSDAATCGCLLAAVREIHRNPYISCIYDRTDGRWYVGTWNANDGGVDMIADPDESEGQALLNAINMSPNYDLY
jgi:hypothetical protein